MTLGDYFGGKAIDDISDALAKIAPTSKFGTEAVSKLRKNDGRYPGVTIRDFDENQPPEASGWSQFGVEVREVRDGDPRPSKRR